MITTDRLPTIAKRSWDYGGIESIVVNKPVGVDPLPDEWEIKLGRKDLPSSTVYEIEDVHLYGPAMVGVKDDVILDTAYFGRIDLWERNYSYFEQAVSCMGMKPFEAKGVYCSFISVWSNNYYHWILDQLPKIEAIDKYHKETGENVTILVPPDVPQFVLDTFDLFIHYPYIAWQPLHAYHYQVEKLLVPTTRRRNGYMYPSAIKWLHSLVKEKAYTSGKVYVTRKYAKTRDVKNEWDFSDRLLELGFSIITPEHFSLLEQQKVFGTSEMIIGPHGAGLANMVWGDAPKVIELVTPDYTNPCIWLIAAAMGWDYGFVICDPLPGEHMVADWDKLKTVMEVL